MKTSESIKAIAPALIKAQGEIKGSVVDAANPFFKSSYATLEAVWDAVKGPLNANGLFLSQGSIQSPGGDWALITRLIHVSGEWIETSYPMVVTKEHDPQAMGSSCTYSRRYSLKAILSIPDLDDDAEKATTRAPQKATQETKGVATTKSSSDFKVPFGKFKDQNFYDLPLSDTMNYAQYLERSAKEKGKPMGADAKQFVTLAYERLNNEGGQLI